MNEHLLLVELSWGALVPGVAVVILGGIAWLFKQVFYQPLQELKEAVPKIDNRLVALQTGFNYYLKSRSIDAIPLLDKPNPAPPEIRAIFKKLREGELSENEHRSLTEYLNDVGQGRVG